MTIDVALEDIADLVDAAATLAPGEARPYLQLSGLVLHTAAGVAHYITAAELAEIQRARAIGRAAGQAAYDAGKVAGHESKGSGAR